MGRDNSVDLSVDFCGFHLENPFMLSSAPPTRNKEMILRAFDAGWAGAICKSLLFTTPTQELSPRFASLHSNGNLIGFENVEIWSHLTLEQWCSDIQEIKRQYPNKLLGASVMTPPNIPLWPKWIQELQSAGIDMIELNLSCPHLAVEGMGASYGQDPNLTAEVVKQAKDVAEVPVIAKLQAMVIDIVAIGVAAKKSGADGLSAINTVAGFMGIDLDKMEPKPSINGVSTFGGLSGPLIKPIALRIVAELAKGAGLPVSGIGGISNWRDAVEFLMCGATTLQLCTAVMCNGYRIIEDLKVGLSNYLYEKGIESVKEIIGRILPKICADLADLDYTYKVVPEFDKTKCVKCDLCYIACRDGGFDAIKLDGERLPTVDEEKCDGCSLCEHICPVLGCVKMTTLEKRRIA